MHYLIISIFASVAVSVLLKIARSKNIGLGQAVAVNYIVCTALTCWFLKPNLAVWQTELLPHAWLFVLLGVLLPSVFIVMGRAAQQAGIVKADAAQRLSLFLPIVAAFTVFGETLALNRIIGIVLAFAALLCLLHKPQSEQRSATPVWLLLGVWAGYGTIDILLKQLSKAAGTGSNMLVMFVLAGILMFAYLLVKKTRWTRADWLGGLLLGCLNFTNILFYIRAHQVFKDNPTLVFAGMNMGVIVLGTLAGAWLFREKISKTNALGIALALSAMVCMYLWQLLLNLFQAA